MRGHAQPGQCLRVHDTEDSAAGRVAPAYLDRKGPRRFPGRILLSVHEGDLARLRTGAALGGTTLEIVEAVVHGTRFEARREGDRIDEAAAGKRVWLTGGWNFRGRSLGRTGTRFEFASAYGRTVVPPERLVRVERSGWFDSPDGLSIPAPSGGWEVSARVPAGIQWMAESPGGRAAAAILSSDADVPLAEYARAR